MKVGIVYPQIELRGDPEGVRQLGLAAEAAGFDHFTMFDHVLGAVHEGRDPPLAGPYDENDPFHDPFVSIGYLAALTQRLEFFTGVLVLPQRQTALVARQAADADLFSNGRMNLGVGTGWSKVEYEAMGQAFETRGKRLDEQIQLLRQLWTGDVVDWKGQFDRVDRAALCPKPNRQIPIYCGGGTPPAFRRAARVADGFIFGGAVIQQLVEEWRGMQDLLKGEGRNPDEFLAHTLIINKFVQALPVNEAVDALKIWQDAGGSGAGVVSLGQSFTSADQHADYFNEILTRFRG